MASETKKKGPGPGGRRPGAGRPKGSRNKKIEIDPHGSTARLESLGFDPVEATVKMYFEVEKKIAKMEEDPKSSTMAISNLYNTKEKLVNNLMRYGYRQVPEKTEVEQNVQTFGITLTDQAPSDVSTEAGLQSSEPSEPAEPLH